MMPVIMKALGMADDSREFGRDLWVQSVEYDLLHPSRASWVEPNGDIVMNGAYGGQIILTPRRENARRFENHYQAMKAWATQSTTRPWRPDGKPNKPLTALTVEIQPA